jgi:hypothetical protein
MWSDKRTAVVLQPSFFPWRGYFDLVARSDVFVFYDDVQYDKHGWRNRNRIKTAAGPQWLTVPVRSKGNLVEGMRIDQAVIDARDDWKGRHVERIRHAYRKAPFFVPTFAFVEELYARQTDSLADFTIATTIAIAARLGLRVPEFVRSSALAIPGAKTDKLIGTLDAVRAAAYISGPAARAYILPERFAEAGIALGYIEYRYPEYAQLHGEYDANLSILDLLFMVGDEASRYIQGSEVCPA